MKPSPTSIIIGLGQSGLSVARFLASRGDAFAVYDTRQTPPGLDALRALSDRIPVICGEWNPSVLAHATRWIMSPGIPVNHPAIACHYHPGIDILGDIELLAQTTNRPVIAITGTNAKSTVTTLVGLMAQNAGIATRVGGNLGPPALDLLSPPPPDLFVLEISSFQLETTRTLTPAVAAILNITPDHLDRYDTFDAYCQTKQRIYENAKHIVYNQDDPLTYPTRRTSSECLAFSLQSPKQHTFGLLEKNGELYFAYEDQPLMSARELPLIGKQSQANALAALAIGHADGLPMASMLHTLRTFEGLPHRCQFVREHRHVRWYNDSKGTNVGATLAAIHGLGSVVEGRLILIAGGISKNADFSPLLPAIRQYVKAAVLIGEAASQLAELFKPYIPVQHASSMEDAVTQANAWAEAGDAVLLSPACASFDMFKHFEHRGEVFIEYVRQL